MLAFSAEKFYWCGAKLREIRCDCYLAAMVCIDGEPGVQMSRESNGPGREKAIKDLPYVAKQFREVGLVITADTVLDLVKKLQQEDHRRSIEWLIENIGAVESLALKELRGQLFLYVSPEKAKFWPAPTHPLGSAASQFPSASPDIFSAATCLATGHSTAAVFHLMRVLEIGLTALGKVFGVSLAHTNWGPAIDQIESAVREMHKDQNWKVLPDCKDLQTFYAQAASHFGILKDAWRNYTMHGRVKYEQDEAERIFDNVRGFMQKLSTKLAE